MREVKQVKKVLAFLLALLCMLSVTACTSESMKQADNSEVYRQNVVDFTLFIPEEWILDTTSFVVSAHVSDTDPSGVTMTQAGLSGGLNEVPTIFENTKTELASLYTFRTLAEAYERKVADLDAAVYQYSLTDKATGVTLNYLQCMFIQNATLYTFTYHATPELYEMHLATVTEILDAICLGKGEAPTGMVAAVSAGSRDVDCSDFKIQIPEDWVVDTSTGIFTAMGPTGDASNLSIMRATVEAGTSSSDYYEAHKDSLKETLKDYEMLTLKKDFITKDDAGKSYNAVTLEYTATMSGQDYHFKQLFCVVDTTVYLVTFSGPEALYQTHTDAINKAIESFTLVNK